MTWRALALVSVLASTARADQIDDLVAVGEAAGRSGAWSVAIDAFKRADAQRPLAKHACLIGLAYARRELWPQAELFFARCHERATATDPLPDWLADAEAQLADKLAATKTVAVAFAITPSDAAAKISVSSFAPDETFTPHPIHLAPGAYTIAITAPDYEPQHRELVIPADAASVPPVTVALVHDAAYFERSSTLPRNLLIGGVALVGLGAALHIALVVPVRERLEHPLTVEAQQRDQASFETRRDIVVGVYVAGAVTIATALALRSVFARKDVTVSASIAPDHVGVGVTWVH